jgi:prepilin-type N-terminal cleavage/methylation domain-containing protein
MTSRNRQLASRFRHARGFTLVELLIVATIVLVLAALGYPALQLMLVRSKLTGSAREVVAHLSSARMEAMRMGRTVVVVPDYDKKTIVGWLDENEDLVRDPDEDLVFELRVPPGGNRGVYLMGPDLQPGTEANPFESVDRLTDIGTKRGAVFESDGSIRDAGGFRIADGKNPANIFEVLVAPQATARISVRKYVYDGPNGDDFYPQGGNSWEWY